MNTHNLELSQLRINQMKFDNMRNVIIEFLEHTTLNLNASATYKNRAYYSNLSVLFGDFELSDIDWIDLQNLVKENSEEVKVVSDFLVFLLEQDYYKGFHKNKLLDLKPYLLSEVNKSYSLSIFDPKNNIESFFTFKHGKQYKLVYIPLEKSYLKTLLFDFVVYSGKGRAVRDKRFFEVFETSMCGEEVKKLSDFNYQVFNKQFKYFSDQQFTIDSKYTLVAFYIYLSTLPGGEKIFTKEDPINLYFLIRNKFVLMYSQGYRVVSHNNIDEIPEWDMWVLRNDGPKNFGNTLISSDMPSIDFTAIINPKHRQWVKHWCWKFSKNIMCMQRESLIFKDFLNFISNLQDEKIVIFTKRTDTKYDIIPEHISTYRNEIAYGKERKVSSTTVRQKIFYVRSFLGFIEQENLGKVDPMCYKYCVTRGFIKTNDSDPLSDENVKCLLVELSKRASEGNKDVHYLYFVMVYMQLFTELRISHIRAITIDSIKTDLKNKSYIEMQTKVSAGENKKIQITKNVKKMLDTVIVKTENLRNECKDPETKTLLFIQSGNRNIIRNISESPFYKHLTSTATSLGFECNSSNLRDTYMTKAMEAEIEGLISEFSRGVLTDHASTRTDDAHYAKADIRKILQITYNIIIGDVNINGEIVSHIPMEEIVAEKQVSNGCGLCKSPTCVLKNNLDCLMCQNFITSYEFINAFEIEIAKLDCMYENQYLQHEKEHIQQIKRLCLEYISRILEKSGVIVFYE